jgi:dolichol-phosphate mannosyltransferase
MSDGIVIIPTYNEIENIEAIVRAVFSLHNPLICSSWMTIHQTKPQPGYVLQQEFPARLFLEVREKKSGSDGLRSRIQMGACPPLRICF